VQRRPSRLSRRLKERSRDEGGFSLVELLVVILIVSILAAIAIPSFLGQKSRAYDVSAKELARTAETTAETYATDHNGTYENMNTAALQKDEGSLPSCPGSVSEQSNACLLSATAEGSGNEGYKVVTRAANTGDEFTITKNKSGVITRMCTSSPSRDGCSGGATGSW